MTTITSSMWGANAAVAFDVKPGYACGNTKFKYRFMEKGATTLPLCQAACAVLVATMSTRGCYK
jgi:hypothetical protein